MHHKTQTTIIQMFDTVVKAVDEGGGRGGEECAGALKNVCWVLSFRKRIMIAKCLILSKGGCFSHVQVEPRYK